MSKENKAIFEMLLCAALWSIAGVLMKLLPWTGFSVSSIRSLIAGLTFLIYMRIQGIPFIFNRATILGGILTGCVYICFASANKLTTAANAIVLQFTSPVFIILISAAFLHQRIRKRDLLTVIFLLVGIALMFSDRMASGYLLGNLVALTAGAFMALMYILIGEQKAEERFSTVLIGQTFTFLVGLPSVILSRPVMNGTTILVILVLGVIQLGIPYILYVRASEYCPPLACCLLGGLEPVLNPIWVMIFENEIPGIMALVGGVIVIISVTLWCLFSGKSANGPEETKE